MTLSLKTYTVIKWDINKDQRSTKKLIKSIHLCKAGKMRKIKWFFKMAIY